MDNRINWENYRVKNFHESWWKVLEPFFTSEEAYNMLSKLNEEVKRGNKILPDKNLIYRAFSTDFNNISSIFVGLSPYVIPNISDGICFSCGISGKEQPSLTKLLNCLENDLGYKDERNPDLFRWQTQGVMMLNISLTTIPNDPKAHLNIWKSFMKFLWTEVFSKKELIFVYFGQDAKVYQQYENKELHKSYVCKHPSYYARNNEEMTEKPFSFVNNNLKLMGKNEIKWMEFGELPWKEEKVEEYKEFI